MFSRRSKAGSTNIRRRCASGDQGVGTPAPQITALSGQTNAQERQNPAQRSAPYRKYSKRFYTAWTHLGHSNDLALHADHNGSDSLYVEVGGHQLFPLSGRGEVLPLQNGDHRPKMKSVVCCAA